MHAPSISELKGLMPGPCDANLSFPTHVVAGDTWPAYLDCELPYDIVASMDDSWPCIGAGAALLGGPPVELALATVVPSSISQGTGVPGSTVDDGGPLSLHS